MFQLYNDDNIKIMDKLFEDRVLVDLAFCDCIYESLDFEWIKKTTRILKENGILIIMTDFHSVAEMKIYLDNLKLNFINWCIYKQEWGSHTYNCFPKKHDDILIYSKGRDYKFHYDRILIPKKTAGTNFDSGKLNGMKIPCDVFDDLGNFSTVSKERVKLRNKNIQWQKPLKLLNRLLLPFTNKEDLIIDPFMGSNSTGLWCKNNNRNFIGIENNPEVFKIAKMRLEN